MTQVQMKDGEIRTIAEPKDFLELIDEYMGFDCFKYAKENLHDEDEFNVMVEEVERLEEVVEEIKERLDK